MAEGITALYIDLQALMNGTDPEPFDRAKRTALTLTLNTVEELIHNRQFGDARAEVIKAWADGDYEDDIDDYVNERLQQHVLD